MTDKSSNYLVSLKLQAEDMVSGVVKKILGEAQTATGQTHGKSLSRVQEIGKAWQGVTRSITSTFSGIRNTLGAVNSTVQAISGFGIRDIAGSFLNASIDMENVQLSIATLLQTVDMSGSKEFANFNKAQEKTISLMQTMRDEAAKTPVEFEDIAGSFQQIMPLARELGVSLEEIVKLSGATATWDRILGKSGVSATDIRQLLGGQNSIVQINNPLLKKNLEELKKYQDEVSKDKAKGGTGVQAQARMLKRIVEILGISDEANAAWEKSFDGRMNNLKSVMKMMVAEGSSPIFEQLKGTITSITQWMQKHPAEVKATVEKIASTLWKIVKAIGDILLFVGDNFSTIATGLKIAFKLWIAAKLGGFISSMWKLVVALKGLKLGGALGAASAGAATVGAAGAGAVAAKSGLGGLKAIPLIGTVVALGDALDDVIKGFYDSALNKYTSGLGMEEGTADDLLGYGSFGRGFLFNPLGQIEAGVRGSIPEVDAVEGLAKSLRGLNAAKFMANPSYYGTPAGVQEMGMAYAKPFASQDKIRAELNITVKSDGSLGIESASDGMSVKVQNRGASAAGTNAGGQ